MGSLYLAIRSRRENIELARLVKTAQNQGYTIPGKNIIKAASLIRQYAKVRITHVKSEEYLNNIISRLKMDPEILKRMKKKIKDKDEYFQCLRLGAKRLLLNFPLTERGGRNPFILAASIIIAADILLARQISYHHCYCKSSRRGILTQKYIAEFLNIAEFTLREHFLLLAKPLMEAEIQKNNSEHMYEIPGSVAMISK